MSTVKMVVGDNFGGLCGIGVWFVGKSRNKSLRTGNFNSSQSFHFQLVGIGVIIVSVIMSAQRMRQIGVAARHLEEIEWIK